MASGPSVAGSYLGQRGLLLPGWPPRLHFPPHSLHHKGPPDHGSPQRPRQLRRQWREWQQQQQLLCAPLLGPDGFGGPPGRGLVVLAPWRQWPRSSMRHAARPSARNSPSTSSPLAPTSTLQNSCRPSCGGPAQPPPSLASTASCDHGASSSAKALQHLWSPLKNSHHCVKVQIQLLAWNFQKMERQK